MAMFLLNQEARGIRRHLPYSRTLACPGRADSAIVIEHSCAPGATLVHVRCKERYDRRHTRLLKGETLLRD